MSVLQGFFRERVFKGWLNAKEAEEKNIAPTTERQHCRSHRRGGRPGGICLEMTGNLTRHCLGVTVGSDSSYCSLLVSGLLQKTNGLS